MRRSCDAYRTRARAHNLLLRCHNAGVWSTAGEAGLAHSIDVLTAEGTPPTSAVASPLAIEAYAVASAYGGDDALARFTRRAHDVGLRVVVDFVPNHMASDHACVRADGAGGSCRIAVDSGPPTSH